MWRRVGEGMQFSGSKEAFTELRARARAAIAEGDMQGVEVRHILVKLTDGNGTLLFEGTFAQAARLEIDGQVFLPMGDP